MTEEQKKDMEKAHKEHIIYENESVRVVCDGYVYQEFNGMTLCQRRGRDIERFNASPRGDLNKTENK